MLKKNDCQILGLALIPSMVIFIIFSIVYDTPLIFDDYRYLRVSLSEDFRFSDIANFVSRSPLFALMLYVLLKLDFLQSSFWFFLNLFFAFHVLTVGLVILYVNKATGLKEVLFDWKNKTILIISIAVLSFFPNFMELIVWPHATPFFVGGFLMALGLFSSSYSLKAFLFFCSYCTYETFVIPSIVLSILPFLVNFNYGFNFKWKIILKEIGVFLAAFLAFYILRVVLGKIYGEYEPLTELPTWDNFMRLLRYLYKIEYHTSIWEYRLEILMLVILGLILVAKKPVNLVYLNVLIGLMIIGGIHDLLIPYEGYRVIYGAFLIRCGIIALGIVLIGKYLHHQIGFTVQLSILLIFFIAYIPSHIRTWKIRTFDAAVFERNYTRFSNIYKNSNNPATVVIGEHIAEMHRDDWVIDGKSRVVLDIFKHKLSINKPLDILFLGENTSASNFPRIYPACYMNRNTGRSIPDQDAFAGEAVFANPEDNPGHMVFGPYTTLDSGSYTVAFRLKGRSFVDSGKEVGNIDIVAGSGVQVIIKKTLFVNDFNENEYETFLVDFTIDKKINDVETRVFFSGNSRLFVDHITIKKRENLN